MMFTLCCGYVRWAWFGLPETSVEGRIRTKYGIRVCKCHTKSIGLCGNLEEEGKEDEEKDGGSGILGRGALV